MRYLKAFLCVVMLGCGATADEVPVTLADKDKVADLGTRKSGIDWPRFLGPKANSVSPEKGIIAPWPHEGLRIVWQKPVGTGYGMPSIAHGRLFQFDRHGDQARLTCLKSETGDPLWNFEYLTDYQDFYGYNNGPRCAPLVDGDRVYIYGVEGKLHCLSASDGKLLWKVDTKTDFGVVQNFFGVGSSPAVEGDLLIVQVGGSPKDSPPIHSSAVKGNGTGVVAFDKLTGKVKYRVSDELASYSSPVLATIGDRRWCFVFARGGLIGFEPTNGKLDFRFPWRSPILESVNAANPVIVGDRVFISETYGPGSALLLVKPGSCDVVWDDAVKGRDKSLQCHWNTPIYHDGYVYGCSGRYPNIAELRCIEFNTGKIVWRQPGVSLVSLLMVDGHFICLSQEGEVTLLKVNPQKYELVSKLQLEQNGKSLLEEPCWAAPILSHGLLYVKGKDRLVCLELIPDRK